MGIGLFSVGIPIHERDTDYPAKIEAVLFILSGETKLSPMHVDQVYFILLESLKAGEKSVDLKNRQSQLNLEFQAR